MTVLLSPIVATGCTGVLPRASTPGIPHTAPIPSTAVAPTPVRSLIAPSPANDVTASDVPSDGVVRKLSISEVVKDVTS